MAGQGERMTVIDFSVEDIQRLSDHLSRAQSEMEKIAEQLDRDIKAAEKKWGGDSQQAFERFYAEWRKGVAAHLSALKKTAEQLRGLVEAHQRIE
jgi:WXG100 family type VII secretion target